MDKNIEEPKIIKKVTKGNCTVVFVEQTNTAEPDYWDKLHETIARLLVKNYHRTKDVTN
ncbi:hypothetical protein [Sutcliffiella sp. NC1]|uniref:hypothetical protein n=1 Tax=Sutcliffiella sp. NC1 TaxID=3004096 RepID=UPI0022DD128A|nr:hypothetical protein [Sutcliffiella sp. NC1]WBL16344.1 hypothetical protein O1A01_06850 [Sutcliffiella sp. NC1]